MAVSQCEQKRGKRNKGEMKLKRNKLWTIVLAGTLFMTACTPSQKNNNSSVAGTEAVSGIQGQSGNLKNGRNRGEEYHYEPVIPI